MNTLTPMPLHNGLFYRSATGPEDGAAFAEIHEARRGVDKVDPSDSYETCGTAGVFEEALARQKKEGTLGLRPVVERDGKIVAYGKIESWPESDGTIVYLLQGWTHPEARNLGIGRTLLGWMEREAIALAGRDHPGERVEFAANASSTEISATELLLDCGYRAQYTVAELRFDKSQDCTALKRMPLLPEGICVGIPSPEDYQAITSTVVAAFKYEYDAGRFNEMVEPDGYLEELSGDTRTPQYWRVARQGKVIVALVLCDVRTDAAIAEIVEVAVLPAWRRKGLARYLATEVLQLLLSGGIADIRLCTIEQFQTRAIDLYQSLGFKRYKDFPRYRKAFASALSS